MLLRDRVESPQFIAETFAKKNRNIVELLSHSSEDTETVPIQSACYSAAVITGLWKPDIFNKIYRFVTMVY
jgi:hypothetical protein